MGESRNSGDVDVPDGADGAAAAPAPRRDYRQEVTDRIIEALENGVAPWQKGWSTGAQRLPYNAVTSKSYRGGNTIALLLEQRSDPRWMTYRQAQASGWQVRRGARGVRIEYWKFDDVAGGKRGSKSSEPDDDRDVDVKGKPRAPRPFYAVVFNAEQIDGIPALPAPEQFSWESVERVERLLAATGVEIRHGGDSAYYLPTQRPNVIHLPPREHFQSSVAYYDTALHELAHWTGHNDRLGRPLEGRFGDESYAREELRAELGAAFIATALGVARDADNNASYIKSWIGALREDKNEIFRAAADAQKICDYVLELERALEQTTAGDTEAESEARSRIAYSLVMNQGSDEARGVIASTLEQFPLEILTAMDNAGARFRALSKNEKYIKASPALRALGVDVDTWPVRPAGLFVVADKTVYIRTSDAMTIAHEAGHAVDFSLGDGSGYASSVDSRIRSAFASAREFVTPYAGSGLDEFYAECFRAYLGINSPSSPWVPVSRERLEKYHPDVARYFDEELVRLRRAQKGLEASGERSNDLGDALGRNAASLPVYEPLASDIVDRRENFEAGFDQIITVLGRNVDGDRIFGALGAGVLSVPRTAFSSEPQLGESVRIRRVDDQDVAIADAPDISLAVGG